MIKSLQIGVSKLFRTTVDSSIDAVVARPTLIWTDCGSSIARGNFLTLSLTLEISELESVRVYDYTPLETAKCTCIRLHAFGD